METPSGKKMRAVPFTVQFVTWFEEDMFPSHVPYEVLESMCKQGFIDLSAETLAKINDGWQSIYLEVESGVKA